MAQDIGSYFLYVLWCDITLTAYEGVCFCGHCHENAGPWRSSELDEPIEVESKRAGVAGRPNQREDVILYPFIHVDFVDPFAGFEDSGGVGDDFELGLPDIPRHHVHDDFFFLEGRISDLNLEHEPVDLGLR
ncbi:MAG: hypothetical protein BWY82_02629 [Verrucomicrobia bacterium ADurb.Bin474]|nr:MAG: hypothetical protein BWY82_02629 [Verrucomicrobia bacterium ADurb.Bin474]